MVGTHDTTAQRGRVRKRLVCGALQHPTRGTIMILGNSQGV